MGAPLPENCIKLPTKDYGAGARDYYNGSAAACDKYKAAYVRLWGN